MRVWQSVTSKGPSERARFSLAPAVSAAREAVRVDFIEQLAVHNRRCTMVVVSPGRSTSSTFPNSVAILAQVCNHLGSNLGSCFGFPRSSGVRNQRHSRAPLLLCAMDKSELKVLVDEQRQGLRQDLKEDILSDIQQLDNKFENKIQEMHAKIMDVVSRKIEELKFHSIPPSEASTSGSVFGHHNKRPRIDKSEVQVQSANDAQPNQVWILGFPRDLLRTKLEKFATDLVLHHMPSLKDKFAAKAFNLENKCSILFQDNFGAHMFLSFCGNEQTAFETTQLRARPDRSAHARMRGRILGKLWSNVEAKIDLEIGKYKLGTSPAKGKLFVMDEKAGDMWVLFQVTTHGSQEDVISFSADECTLSKIDETMANDLIDRSKSGVGANST